MRRIAVVSAYALVPMVMAQFTYVLLSNVAIYDEGALLKALLLIGYLWSGWLLFYGVKEAHQFFGFPYATGDPDDGTGDAVLRPHSGIGVWLLQQLVAFFATIFNELILRSV